MDTLELHPQILQSDGQNTHVVLTWAEFQAVQELLEDALDLQLLREAREESKDDPGISHEEMKRQLGL